MARLSKTNSFKIHHDAGIPTPETENPPEQYDRYDEQGTADDADSVLSEHARNSITSAISKLHDDKRISNYTATTISTTPEFDYPTDSEYNVVSAHHPYTPLLIRPSFRRPESVRRMQMTSPRQSILSRRSSKVGSPRSVRSVPADGSPRRRNKTRLHALINEDEDDAEEKEKQYPLVLLHICLLPIDPPWSVESMRDLLPIHVVENLRLLQSKLSATTLERGILIQHPREEYDLLEERLLEALELKEERVTKCGHFLRRQSDSTIARVDSNSDSGVGSSIDGSDEETCETCGCHVSTSKDGVGDGNSKWQIKVFAANGLLRASAWAAAWPEMESVDVEILPWISDEVRRKLDERRRAEALERSKASAQDVTEVANEQTVVRHGHLLEQQPVVPQTPARKQQTPVVGDRTETSVASWSPPHEPLDLPDDLPQIYRPSQIPLAVLLRNYIYLLARDRRNVVMFGLVLLLALLLAARPGSPGIANNGIARVELGSQCAPRSDHTGSVVHDGTAVADAMEVTVAGAAETAIAIPLLLPDSESDMGTE